MKDALCPVCRRASAGIVLQLPEKPVVDVCSLDCARVWMDRKPLDHREHDALAVAGQSAGDYLDRIGKTDLATLTRDEWHEFCKIMFETACEHLRSQAGEWVPF